MHHLLWSGHHVFSLSSMLAIWQTATLYAEDSTRNPPAEESEATMALEPCMALSCAPLLGHFHRQLTKPMFEFPIFLYGIALSDIDQKACSFLKACLFHGTRWHQRKRVNPVVAFENALKWKKGITENLSADNGSVLNLMNVLQLK